MSKLELALLICKCIALFIYLIWEYRPHFGTSFETCYNLVGLVGFNDAFNTIRLYKLQGCIQKVVLSGKHNTKSAVFFRFRRKKLSKVTKKKIKWKLIE